MRLRLQHCNDFHHLMSRQKWKAINFLSSGNGKDRTHQSYTLKAEYIPFDFLSLFYIWNCICLTCTLTLYIEIYSVNKNISLNTYLKIRYNNQSVPTAKS